MIIELTQGQQTIVDDDAQFLLDYSWYADKRRDGRYIADNSRIGKMHRFVMSNYLGRALTSDEEVDHENQNTLDNRIENLRLATRQLNQANTGVRTDNKLGVKGVRFHQGKYEARITVNKQKKVLGRFDTVQEAADRYLQAAKEFFGQFARS